MIRAGARGLVHLRMPEMIVGRHTSELSIIGSVVHVELRTEPRTYGVGVKFPYYKAATPNRSRLLLIAETLTKPLGV